MIALTWPANYSFHLCVYAKTAQVSITTLIANGEMIVATLPSPISWRRHRRGESNDFPYLAFLLMNRTKCVVDGLHTALGGFSVPEVGYSSLSGICIEIAPRGQDAFACGASQPVGAFADGYGTLGV